MVRSSISGRCSTAWRILRRCCGRAGQSRRSGEPAVAVVGSRAATTYALEVGERLGGELAVARRRSRQRSGARRRFGGTPGMPERGRSDGGGARFGAR